MPRKQVSYRMLSLAAEENPREFFAAMVREGFRSTKKVDWVISGVPEAFFNPVIRTDFPEAAARDIRRMVARFDSAESPMSWWVSPSTRPGNLADQLLANGFKFEESVPAMSLPLERLKPTVHPDGLVIKRVRSPRELKRWFVTWAETFEIPAKSLEPLYRVFLRKESSTDSDVVNYAGFLGGRLLTVSTLFLGKRAAGIYNVGTVAPARGKGLGGAMTHFALSEAHRRGFAIGTLQSSKLGYGVYTRLGFEECFKLSNYVRVS
jgi:ribosomal protein S18 acetylase RimI-like enzyme